MKKYFYIIFFLGLFSAPVISYGMNYPILTQYGTPPNQSTGLFTDYSPAVMYSYTTSTDTNVCDVGFLVDGSSNIVGTTTAYLTFDFYVGGSTSSLGVPIESKSYLWSYLMPLTSAYIKAGLSSCHIVPANVPLFVKLSQNLLNFNNATNTIAGSWHSNSLEGSSVGTNSYFRYLSPNTWYNPSSGYWNSISSPINGMIDYGYVGASLPLSVLNPYVDFTYPVQSATTSGSFSWGVKYNNPYTGVGHTTQVQVVYDGPSSSTENFYNLPSGISANTILQKSFILGAGTYTAELGLFDVFTNSSTALYTLIATSSQITFTVVQDISPTGLNTDFFKVDCSMYSFGFWSDTNSQALGCMFKQIGLDILAVFVKPPSLAVDYFNGSISQIKSAPPFNIVFGVLNSVSSTAGIVGASSSRDLYLDIPQIGVHTPILTSSTLETAVGTTWKNNLFSVMQSLLWLGAGFGIIALL